MRNFRAGVLIDRKTYKSFLPTPLRRGWVIDDMGVLSQLSRADRWLGRLDMYSEYVDIDLFIRMHIAKEATQSSRIEGTRTNMEEAFLSEGEVLSEKRDDWEEVQNYISAMNEAVGYLGELPFSVRLIRGAHRTLLRGVRGEHKLPGEFRRSQNWVGGSSPGDAAFVPPAHTEVVGLMSDIELFANDTGDDIPDLIKVALIHYQFETVHPFLDGNGRIGRLLIPLYLVSKGILKRPILYLSDFFERNRAAYYDNLTLVRERGDIARWLRFFLAGMEETAKRGVATLDAVMQLKGEVEAKIGGLGKRGASARVLLDALYKHPVVSPAKAAALIGKSAQTAYSLIAKLEREGILKTVTRARRNRLYVFEPYMRLFDRI